MTGYRIILLFLSFSFICPVTAQQRQPWTTSAMRGTPGPPPAFKVERAFADIRFNKPTSIHQIPGTDEFLVTQMNGQIYTFSKSATSSERRQVIHLAEAAGGNVSLFSAVLDPDFHSNGFIYTCAVHPDGSPHTRVSRFDTQRNSSGQLSILKDSERVVLKWPRGGHNAGCMRFGPDGLLYIATGDGAGPNPPDGLTTGQDVTDLLGAILRIDVRRGDGEVNYSVPDDNPFVEHHNARPEIFAYGLRNPWKFGVDSETGDLFVADNGWETWEMIHHIRSGGHNCGWPVMEGRAQLRTEVAVGPTPIVPPARDHHHSEANSVIGGPVYRGERLQDLNGFFVYGDYITGTIWALKPDGDGYTYKDVVDTDLRIVDFAQGADGELFVLDYDFTGGVYRVVPNDAEDLSAEFPRLLSETGLFDSVADLKPAAGVLPYDVVAPRWQDGADTQRWVAVPGDGSIERLSDSEPADFPNGTVLVKHLAVPVSPSAPLETQVLHYNGGVWNPYSYLWNQDGSDAELVPPTGATKSVNWPLEDGEVLRTWRAGAVNECRLCHNAGSHFVLGFNPRQLKKKTTDGSSFLTALEHSGLLKSLNTSDGPELVDPHDSSQPLNDRARSYLHANCSMCHHRGGNAIVSFYLSRDLSFEEMNTNKGTGIGTFGMKNAKIIVPGDPLRSVLMYRMSKLGYARMPYIGSQVVDGKGVVLISEWIRSLSDERSSQTARPLVADSDEAKALTALLSKGAEGQNHAAVQTLLASTEGSLALLPHLYSGDIRNADRQAVLKAARTANANIRGLFDHFIPESERKKTLGRNFDPQVVMAKTGDVRRGQLIFFSDNSRCRSCHDVSDARRSVGPTLTEISKKYNKTSELIRQIVKPSEKVDEKYAAWIAVTVSGKVVTGLKVNESEQEVTLQTAVNRLKALSRDEIDELQKSTRSMMPERLLEDLTAQEAADLIAYIQSLHRGGETVQ